MRKLLWSEGVLVVAVVVVAALATAPVQSQPSTSFVFVRGIFKAFIAQGAVGQTVAYRTEVVQNHSVQIVKTEAAGGDITGCTYRLQGSNDGTNWFDISAGDLTCTSNVQGFEQNKPALWVRGDLKTFTVKALTTPTVTLHYAGK